MLQLSFAAPVPRDLHARSMCAGVVGVPNVGKSSLINSLLRTRAAAVGNLPGITRTPQSLRLDK